MRTCRVCGAQESPDVSFVVKGNICLACQRIYTREHYQNNKAAYAYKAKRNRDIYVKAVREFLQSYLREHPCIDCGESDLVVLDFDHKDPSLKVFHVAAAVNRKLKLESIKAEIEKCDVRCANCHRRRTAAQFGWWKIQAPIA